MRGSTFGAQKRIGQALLLLATGLASLIPLQVARAQNSNPCAESNLPSPVIDLIKTKFSGWRPKQTEDLDPDNRRLWLKPHGNDCPGIAVGHFESPERLTYAVLLVPRDPSRPSGRAWARQLGVSHTWLQKLVRQFQADPSKMWRLQAARGDPKFAELSRARDCTEQMKESGELRGSRLAKVANFFKRYPR